MEGYGTSTHLILKLYREHLSRSAELEEHPIHASSLEPSIVIARLEENRFALCEDEYSRELIRVRMKINDD